MPSRCKLPSLAAALALVLALSLARAEDVTIVVPDDGSAVLYSHDAAPDAVLALDPTTAPQAVSMLLSSSAAAMLQAASDEDDVEAVVAPVAAAAFAQTVDSTADSARLLGEAREKALLVTHGLGENAEPVEQGGAGRR